ncbi:MAG TPA: polymer-forming cytoskeletal protein [Candidatus Polarisedimenticolia bacterium]|nr:polymer-forming cytoskeletal protein [Candidatus Polarisedimenticolia bacterium]
MRDSKAAAGDLSGFLGEGTTISGDIRFPDILRVDGRITGKVSSEKELVVGETGEVEAEIDVGVLSVNGRVSGTIRIRERMTIHPRGQVRGELILEKPGLIIEEGGIFEGTIEMSSERKRELKEVKGGSPLES